jgi:outer membrane protein assembly factor BamB
VALCVGLGLGLIANSRFPRQLDRYLSLEPGQASLYRITYSNGGTGFYSINTLKPGSDSIAYAALQGQAISAVQEHVIATNWQGQPGQVHSRDVFYARDGQTLQLIAQREAGTTTEFTPPLPIWSPELLQTDATHPLSGQVKFNDQTFEYALWLDGREALPLPDGSEAEAVRLALELLDAGIVTYRSLSWYVSNVGQVRGEEFDGSGNLLTRTELLASTRLAHPPALPVDELLAGAGTATAFYRENAARTGAHPQADLPDDPLNIAYHLTLDSAFTASPVVADGLLIVADQNGTVSALDAGQAAPRWQFGVGGPVVAAPAVADGLAYIGASDKTLYALTAREGLFVWAFKFRDNIATSPVVSGGVLFIGGEDRTLVALDARTGAERWRYLASERLVSSPAIAEGKVFFGGDDGRVHALEAATGAEVWRTALDAPVVASPAVVDGVVYAGSTQEQFVAIEAATGRILWTAESVFGYKASPAIGEQLVFVADDDGVLRALRRADGNVAWEWHADYGSTFVSSPLLLGKRLVIVDDDGLLHVFEAQTGREEQALLLSQGGVSGSPTWDGQTLYLVTQGKRVLALRAGDEALSPSLEIVWTFKFGGVEDIFYTAPVERDGWLYSVTHAGELWRVNVANGLGERVAQFDETIEAAPALDGGRLYFGTQAGSLIAYDLDQRATLWRASLAGGMRFTPLVSDGRVFAHARNDSGGTLYALQAASGDMLWQVGTDGLGNGSPVRAGEVLVMNGENLIALDPITGNEIWRSASFLSIGGIIAEANVVYAVGAGAQNETLVALDAGTGEKLWQSTEPGTFIFSRPALDLASRTLIAGTSQGTVVGLDAATGATRWRFPADAAVQSDIQIQDGIVYFSTSNGTLYALEAHTGTLLANFKPGAVLTYAPPLVTPERVYAMNGIVLYALEVSP